MNKELENNSTLAHYRIVSKIGKGGMGEVYLAEDTKLDRKVALKILPAEFSEDKDRMGRFVREAKSASALNHPNIITIHDIGEFEGTHYIATEFIDGKTLNDYSKDTQLSLGSALDIAIQTVSALDVAHSAGIVHRDIKPDNVMIRPDGLIKILDFGIAKLSEPPAVAGGLTSDEEIDGNNDNVQPSAAADGSDLEAATAIQSGTIPGMIIGTANYMSPEQAKGEVVDKRTDIFSFGVVLYELISGHLPFDGKTAMEMISSVLKDEPKPLNVSDIHPDLAEIIAKALKKDRNERYIDSKELLGDLESLRKKIEFEAELERTTSPERASEDKTQIIKPDTDETSKANVTAANPNSIAILPFTNISSDEDNEYFCDGLAEELLNALSKIEGLKVAARTSAFSFKGKNTNVSEIGEKLSVKNVLEGSVRKSGDRLRISVQLANASDGYQIWSESFDREVKDIFDIQDEIALAVVDALKVRLFGDEKESVTKRYTNNAAAYQLYLKGRYHFARRTIDDMQKGLDYFEQALEVDPEYALAYVGIADIYNSWTKSLFLPAVEVIPKAKLAAQRALEIDPSLAEAHASLGDSLAIFDWNWEEAEREFKRAIQLNPNVSFIHFTYGISYLVPMGQMDEAIAELERAVELEPLSLIANSILSEVYLYARQNDKALEQARKAFDLNPNFMTSRFWLGHALLANGMNEEAIALTEEILKSSPSNPVFLYLAGQSYAKSGRIRDAAEILEQIRELSKTMYVQSYSLARILAALGENDKAFAELEKAFEHRDWWLPRLRVDPMMDSLHKDPRFNKVLQQIGLPPIEHNLTEESLEAKTVITGSEPSAVAGGLTQSSQEPDKKTTASSTNLQPSATADGSDLSGIPNSKLWLIGLTGLIVLVAGFFGFNYYQSTQPINSIAVLPFENRGSDADTEYLSDGLGESLIYRLSQLPNLKVSPTSSVFRYKGKATDAVAVGNELGVNAVLTGRIVQRGDDLIISVELVDVRSNELIWGEKYERKLSELLATQRQIATEISQNLRLKLSGNEKGLTKPYTNSNEAYQLYLKGRYHFAKRAKDEMLKGIGYFQQAIELDPGFALAYARIADVYNQMPAYPYLSPHEAFPKARAAAKKALEIDPTLPEAHTALANTLAVYDLNWAEADREFKRAIELDPNNADVHFRYGQLFLSATGRHDEAIREITRALELEPLDLTMSALLSQAFHSASQHDKALEQAKKTFELEPGFLLGSHVLGQAFVGKEMYQDAIDTCERALLKNPNSQLNLQIAGYAYAKSGRRNDAERTIASFREIAKSEYIQAYLVASIYAALGEKDKAFAELQIAFQNKDWSIHELNVDPLMAPLRDDPRFEEIVKRLNLPE